jgi:hypothetical protein
VDPHRFDANPEPDRLPDPDPAPSLTLFRKSDFCLIFHVSAKGVTIFSIFGK